MGTVFGASQGYSRGAGQPGPLPGGSGGEPTSERRQVVGGSRSCGCGTEVPVTLPAAIWDPASAHKGCQLSFQVGPVSPMLWSSPAAPSASSFLLQL